MQIKETPLSMLTRTHLFKDYIKYSLHNRPLIYIQSIPYVVSLHFTHKHLITTHTFCSAIKIPAIFNSTC